MIVINSGERTIYHPLHPELKLANPKLTLEDSGAGKLTFRIYGDNPNRESVRSLFPLVTVIRDGMVIFKGRVIRTGKDFYNGRTVEAEGKLAFFNDSCLEPFSFQGGPEELFRMIVGNHNSQVMPWQQFKVGVVTVKDNNDYVVRSSENTMNSWDALKDKCFKSSLGGHIRIRYEADGDYVDWLEDYTKVSSQSIEFARNIVSLSMEMDASETYTALRPMGAEVEGAKVDISSVNGGKTWLVNKERAEEYGIIFAPEAESTWADVTLPENLLRKAQEKLCGSMGALRETYEIRAVDLNLTDGQIEALDICEYVPVVSRPHGVRGNYLLTRADIAIDSPQNSVYYLGASRRVLSDMNHGGGGGQESAPKKISTLENDAGFISEEKAGELLTDYPKTLEVLDIVNGAVADIPAGEDGASAYEVAARNGFNGTEAEWVDSLRGVAGEDGQSPSIAPNPGNTDEIYRLDIMTAEGAFTTPNLKGADTQTCGLEFGRDAEGNWGYIPPGADTVVPFRKEGEAASGKNFPLLGKTACEVVGSIWLEGEGGIEGASEEVLVLSTVLNGENFGICTTEGFPFAICEFVLPEPSDKVGAMWIE